MYTAGLFDLDGTLTDSLDLSAQAFIYTFRRHLQREYSPEEIFAMFGPCEEGVFRRENAREAPAMLKTFLSFYRRRHNQYAAAYPGIADLLADLNRKMPLAVVTGKGREPALITLAKTGLARYFQVLISGSCVQEHKPHPEGIEMALAELGVSPSAAFYLGDSTGDLLTARRAGVAALAALWGARDKSALLAMRPDAAFAVPEELLVWLAK